VLSAPSPREGGEEGEEGVSVTEGGDEVTIVLKDNNDEPVEVIPVPESPTRLAYKQTARIRIGPRGRPTGTLALQISARVAGWDSTETKSAVWPPPPPPSPGDAVRTKP
jgi:hypothetical protein